MTAEQLNDECLKWLRNYWPDWDTMPEQTVSRSVIVDYCTTFVAHVLAPRKPAPTSLSVEEAAREISRSLYDQFIMGGLEPANVWKGVAEIISRVHAEQGWIRKIDGKFSTDGKNVFNTISGESIPDDEPLFLLRARDEWALVAVNAYQAATEPVCNDLHKAGIQQVREKFCRFAAEHPERMKQPGITKHLKLEEPLPSPPVERAKE